MASLDPPTTGPTGPTATTATTSHPTCASGPSAPTPSSAPPQPQPDTTPSPEPHLHDLIAHYLSSYYPSALPSFLSATGTVDPARRPAPDPDLPTLVAEASAAALAAKLGRMTLSTSNAPETGDGEAEGGRWGGMSLENMAAATLPPAANLTTTARTYEVSAANLLAVLVVTVPRRRFDTGIAEYVCERVRAVVVASADRMVRVLDYGTGEVLEILEPHRAPVLCVAQHPTNPRYLITGSMDGTAALSDLITGDVIQTFPCRKFVVRVAFSPDGRWLATASYDASVVVYEAVGPAHPPPDEDEYLDSGDEHDFAHAPQLRYVERHRLTTESNQGGLGAASGNPETLVFSPDGKYLLFTVRGSHELHYLGLPPPPRTEGITGTASASTSPSGDSTVANWTWPRTTKSFNPSPHDAHVSFAVLDIAIHPSGRMLACVTADHAGNAGERVLLYGVEPGETTRLATLWTGTESDPYVMPRVAWLPDGTGLVTSTPTGHINLLGLDGQVRSSLKVHGARQGVPGTSDVVRDLTVVQSVGGEGGQGGRREGESRREGEEVVERVAEGWEVVSVGYDRCVRISK